MNPLPILTYPDKTLRMVSAKVEIVSHPDFQTFIEQMFATMWDSGGIGLAAVQVGVPLRAFVVDVGFDTGPECLINPEILKLEGEPEQVQEGCLSLPGIVELVARHPRVTVRYTSTDGLERIVDTGILKAREAEKRLWAQVVQHEYEHLDGKLMLEKLPKDKAVTALKRAGWATAGMIK